MTQKTDTRQMPEAAANSSSKTSDAALSDDDRALLLDLNRRRESMYGLLSRLYKVEVDADFYSSLCNASFPTGTGNDDVDEGYRLIATYCASQHDDALLDLARDYARVFIGHGNNAYAAAYPFESVYTSEKRLLMQEARDEILEIYKKGGLQIDPSWIDPEDHVALELEYMQIMARRTQEKLQDHDDDAALALLDDQRRFLLKHLVSWTPMLVNDMKRLAHTDLYQGLALLTKGLLAEDRSFLSNIVSEPNAEEDFGEDVEAETSEIADIDEEPGK
jgi:TorA maturation chaperone TorD